MQWYMRWVPLVQKGQTHTVGYAVGTQYAVGMSSIECRHSRHKQFRHKFFFRKKFVCSHGDVFYSFIFAAPVPTRGSCCFIRFKSPSPWLCVRREWDFPTG